MQNDNIRKYVGAVDAQMARVTAEAATGARNTAIRDLAASWAKLVTAMALGPEPELRTCPTCRESGMRDATVCGFCWTKLPRLAPLAPAHP